MDDVVRPGVRLVGDLPRDRDEEPALHVQHALRQPGRPGGVGQQVGMLRVDLQRLELAARARDRLVPEPVAPGLHRDLAPQPPPNDHVLHRGRLLQRRVDELLHRHLAASPQRAVRGHDDLRLGVPQPRSHSRSREPGEDRHLHRAEVRAGVRRDRDFRRHRQEQRDPVARLDPQGSERLGEPCHRTRELGVRQSRPRPVLALPHRGQGVGPRPTRPPVHAVPGQVQPPADEPGRPLRPPREVAHLVPRARELQSHVRDRLGPEALWLLGREPHELPVVVEA